MYLSLPRLFNRLASIHLVPIYSMPAKREFGRAYLIASRFVGVMTDSENESLENIPVAYIFVHPEHEIVHAECWEMRGTDTSQRFVGL